MILQLVQPIDHRGVDRNVDVDDQPLGASPRGIGNVVRTLGACQDKVGFGREGIALNGGVVVERCVGETGFS